MKCTYYFPHRFSRSVRLRSSNPAANLLPSANISFRRRKGLAALMQKRKRFKARETARQEAQARAAPFWLRSSARDWMNASCLGSAALNLAFPSSDDEGYQYS